MSAEVSVLLDLKTQYKTLTGKDFKPASSGGKKDKKEKGNKQEIKQEKKADKKKEELKPSQDERAVKKVTR